MIFKSIFIWKKEIMFQSNDYSYLFLILYEIYFRLLTFSAFYRLFIICRFCEFVSMLPIPSLAVSATILNNICSMKFVFFIESIFSNILFERGRVKFSKISLEYFRKNLKKYRSSSICNKIFKLY